MTREVISPEVMISTLIITVKKQTKKRDEHSQKDNMHLENRVNFPFYANFSVSDPLFQLSPTRQIIIIYAYL